MTEEYRNRLREHIARAESREVHNFVPADPLVTLAQDVAMGHGGWLEIDDEYAPGCRVWVGLPAFTTSAEPVLEKEGEKS